MLAERLKTLGEMVTHPQFLITKAQFLSMLMEEWRQHLQAEKVAISGIFTKYDDNGDGVLTLNEFEVLIKNIEPSMSQADTAHLFMKALSMSTSWNPDEMSPEAFCDMIISQKLGGHGEDIFNKEFYDIVMKA